MSEAHDTLTIHGAGFAEGAKARVRLEGTVYRAGQAPADVDTSALAQAESREQLALPLGRDLIAELCGADEPAHATFVGNVTVAFRPLTPGAPPVTGTLWNARLDFYPPPDRVSPVESAGQLAEFWGATFGKPESGDGLSVVRLEETGLAEASGLHAGDVVMQFGGLSTRGLSDLEPYPGQTSVTLWVQREGIKALLPLEVDVSEFAPRPALLWASGLSLCSALALLLLLTRGPLGRGMALLQWQWVRRRSLGKDPNPLPTRAQRQRPRAVRGVMPFLMVSALFVALSLGFGSLISGLDLVALYALFVLLMGMTQLLGGGFSEHSWGLGRALRSVVRGFVVAFVVLICALPPVIAAGSLSLRDLVLEQQGLPSEFNLFKTPSCFVAATVMWALIVVLNIGVPGADSRSRPVVAHGLPRRVLNFVRVLEFFQMFILCGLFVVLFLGGWAWPESVADALSIRGFGRVGAALLFQLKFTLFYLGVAWVRRQVPQVAQRYTQAIHWRYLVPAGTLALLSAPVWTVATWPEWLHQAVAWSLLGTTTLAALIVVFALRAKPRAVNVSLNPWL